MKNRQLRSGYFNLGPISIPSIAQPVVLTDRDDGTLWLISWSTSVSTVDGYGYLSIKSTVFERNVGVRIYGPYDGPPLGPESEYKLMVRAGNLGFDYTPFPAGLIDIDSSPVYLRQASNSEIRQLVSASARNTIHPMMLVNEEQQDG